MMIRRIEHGAGARSDRRLRFRADCSPGSFERNAAAQSRRLLLVGALVGLLAASGLVGGCGSPPPRDETATMSSPMTNSTWPRIDPEQTVRPRNSPRAAAGLDDLEWLTGCWSSYDANTRIWIEECWSTIVGDMMMGTNRTMRGSRVAAFEHIRIEAHDEGIWYLASPGGRPAIAFMRVVPTSRDRADAANVAVFENMEHDFPQRIIYRGDGRSYLEATIEGVIREELESGEIESRNARQTWRWTR